MVLRFHFGNKATRHRGCQTATVYVDPTRLVSTEHLVRLSRWPVSYLHPRSLELDLGRQPCSAQGQKRRSGYERAVRSAQGEPPSVQQHLPSRMKRCASLSKRASPCSEHARPLWDSSISWTCGHSPSTYCKEKPRHAEKQQDTPGVTGSAEGRCKVLARPVHQPIAMCEKSTQTESCTDRASQTEGAHFPQSTKRQAPAHQRSAVLLHHNRKHQPHCCYCCRRCCVTPRGLNADGSRSASILPFSLRPAWRCSSLKPGLTVKSQASERAAYNGHCCRVQFLFAPI